MGSRGRSIRLRIYFLVAIPLVTMLGLFAVLAYTSVTNFQNLDRAPDLVRATGEPAAAFGSTLNVERTAAVVYLSAPTPANLTAYEAAVKATQAGAATFDAAMEAPGVKASETPAVAAALGKEISDVGSMSALRAGVEDRKLSPVAALQAYTNIIDDEPTLFAAEASSLTNAGAAVQGFGLVEVTNNDEDINVQEAVLTGALESGTLTPQERAAFNQAAGRQQDDSLLLQKLLNPAERNAYNSVFNIMLGGKTKAVLAAYGKVQDAVEGGLLLPEIARETGMSGPGFQSLASSVSNANYRGGLAAAAALLNVDVGIANSARRTVILTGAIGAAGLIITLIVTLLLGRSVNRRLTTLRRSALTLANEQLPSAVARLRQGETVDVAAEAPPLRVGTDEIGQVGQAIDAVRQTALRAAVEESRLRQGVNDMFRNLARRSQSLLQRQLTVLDGMERRAADPDVLDDLFKMDHLTTRMRRHAEGLIILSGAAPGRGWSAPVRLVDVMRGAVAEIEDYARVIVSTQSKSALAGPAVTDVIHLLAELIENATTLSPPFTQVRVAGENVGNGFAIEVEDRGLGMAPSRLAELNERLANPPNVNPANTEQLGLFVVGQLAKRHGIGVMMRPSPYGGITVVVLIPRRLVVDEALPAITAGPAQAMADAAYGANGGYGANGNGYGGRGVPASGNRPNGYGPAQPFPGRTAPVPTTMRTMPIPTPPGSPPDLDNIPVSSPFGTAVPNGGADSGTGSGIRISGALRHQRPNPPAPDADSGARRGGLRGGPDIPVVTGVPVTRPSGGGEPFDVFTPQGPAQPEHGTGAGYQDLGGPNMSGQPPASGGTAGGSSGDGPTPGSAPYGSSTPFGSSAPFGSSTPFGSSAPFGSGAPFGDSGTPGSPFGADSAPLRAERGNQGPASGNQGPASGNQGTASGNQGPASAGSGGGGEGFKGLPRRIRQASLAPQLRASRGGGAEVPQAAPPSPADVKHTLSAMQRGWQQGRSQSQRDTETKNDS